MRVDLIDCEGFSISEKLYEDIPSFFLPEMRAGFVISECPHSTTLELYQKINLLRSFGGTLSRERLLMSISDHLDDYLMQAGMVKP